MMKLNQENEVTLDSEQALAIQQACSLVAPNWPLDRFIAVNSLWEHKHHPIELVSARLAALAGARTTMSADYFLNAFEASEISESALLEAAKAYKAVPDVNVLIDALKTPAPDKCLSVAEIADLKRDSHKMRWQDEIVQQISQFCGEFVTQGSGSPESLYSVWLDFTEHDYGVSLLMGEKYLRRAFGLLPETPHGVFLEVIEEFGLNPYELEIYAHQLLLSINGWASYFAWQRWESNLRQQNADYLESLLAIRMAWELIVWRQLKNKENKVEFQCLQSYWSQQRLLINELIDEHIHHQRHFWVWTHAAELEYQTHLHQVLKGDPKEEKSSPAMQAVFCIDVRSERFRRALESQHEGIQTIGFAGFFGLPISYQPANTEVERPQLPGLVAPAIRARNLSSDTGSMASINKASHWKGWSHSPVSAFTMVETVGWTYVFNLMKNNFNRKKHEKRIDALSHAQDWSLEKEGVELSLEEKTTLVAGVLKGMGLTKNFAPVVLLLGHGSESRNNLHASGLDCGACGGQTGEVNVRVLAALLNDSALRHKLTEHTINIPGTTRFIAGLHNTTTDEIACFAPLHDDRLERWLKQASHQTRQERSRDIDMTLSLQSESKLQRALSDRARDWSEVRPEWGLANNASFIVAPRQRTRALDLEGRAFLHDYNWRDDSDFSLLEQIMTAPMLVTHWINMQYNLSVSDNQFFGSGNKLLHNAVGQHIGVFEGNGGDLRIGLPIQSVHDGENWRHESLRLSVYIAAPREAIEDIIEKHETVRDLIHNNWLFLFRWREDCGIERYRQEAWERTA